MLNTGTLVGKNWGVRNFFDSNTLLVHSGTVVCMSVDNGGCWNIIVLDSSEFDREQGH